MARGEEEKMTRDKVTRMRSYEIEKASFGFAVTQSLQGFEVRRFDAHKNRLWLSKDNGTRWLRRSGSGAGT